MELYERIAETRRAAGLTQEQLGTLVGVTRQAVSKWESGQAVPDALTVARVCQALGVSADYLLLGRTPEQVPAGPVPAERLDVCPCCGRKVSGAICNACGYAQPAVSEGDQRYAVVLTKQTYVVSDFQKHIPELEKYCGFESALLEQAQEDIKRQGSFRLVRRGLTESAARHIAAHLNNGYYATRIVLDDGAPEEILGDRIPAMDVPKKRYGSGESLGFAGTVLAVIVGIIGAVLLLSFL